MRKVPGDAGRAARGRRKSGEKREGGGNHQGRSSSRSFDKRNKQSKFERKLEPAQLENIKKHWRRDGDISYGVVCWARWNFVFVITNKW